MMASTTTITLLALTYFIFLSSAVPTQSDGFGGNHFSQGWNQGWNHFSQGGQPYSQGWHHSSRSAQQFPQSSQHLHQSSQHLHQSSQHTSQSSQHLHQSSQHTSQRSQHFAHSSQHSPQSSQHFHHSSEHSPQSSHRFHQSSHHFHQSSHHFHQSSHVTKSRSFVSSTSTMSSAPTASGTGGGLDPNAMSCQVALPANALTAEGLSTPWELLPPCSQAVSTQQAFAEAAVIDSNGQLSIYHPLIIDQGKTPQAAPVVPQLDGSAKIALFFGFNGDVLTLVDKNGQDTNTSPILKQLQCVNGLPGVQGDVFGQVSWCNTEPFWSAANAAVQNGQLDIPDLGNDDQGKSCPSSRSFEIIDQDQSDNLPTKYLLLPDGSTVQFTANNKAKFSDATEIDNASDESLIADFIDPAIGCTPFEVDSIDDPGSQVSSLATNELQAFFKQQEPVALVPLNDPDTLLTASGGESSAKTNAYRLGVNQPQLGSGSNTDDGSPTAYCDHMISIQPPFLASFQDQLTAVTTPDAGIGNNLFTFLCNRFLQSVTNLKCKNQNTPVKCQLDGNGAATACTIGNNNMNGGSSSKVHSSHAHGHSSRVHNSHSHGHSSRVHSSHAHHQSSAVHNSHAHGRSSRGHSSHFHGQSSRGHSSHAHSQSSRVQHSSHAHGQSFGAHSSHAHGQGFSEHSSQAHGQSFGPQSWGSPGQGFGAHNSFVQDQSSGTPGSVPNSQTATATSSAVYSQGSSKVSSAVHSQSAVAGSSPMHGQSSAPTSSAVRSQGPVGGSSPSPSQTSVAASSPAYNPSNIAPSSAVQDQSSAAGGSGEHSASYVADNSPVYGQSFTPTDSAAPTYGSIPHNFGTYSAYAGANKARGVREVTSTDTQPSATTYHRRKKP